MQLSHSVIGTELLGNQWFGMLGHISFSSVQFSHSVVSDSLQPHELQHSRPPCPSPPPGDHPNSHPSSQWCHSAISSSVVPFYSCPQSLPAPESFPMNQLFTWGGQSTGVSALALFLPKETQDWSPFEWTGWISLQSDGLSRVFSNTAVQKYQFCTTVKDSCWCMAKPIQYCKVISLQLKQINLKKKKASILRSSTFSTVQISHLYMTTGKP